MLPNTHIFCWYHFFIFKTFQEMHVLISTGTWTNYLKHTFPMRMLRCLFENRCLSSEDLQFWRKWKISLVVAFQQTSGALYIRGLECKVNVLQTVNSSRANICKCYLPLKKYVLFCQCLLINTKNKLCAEIIQN